MDPKEDPAVLKTTEEVAEGEEASSLQHADDMKSIDESVVEGQSLEQSEETEQLDDAHEIGESKELEEAQPNAEIGVEEEAGAVGVSNESTENPVTVRSTTYRRKRDARAKNRDVKNIEDLIKTLPDGSDRKNLESFLNKFNNLFTDNKALEGKVMVLEKNCSDLAKERDQLQAVQARLLLGKTRLESLCRELQRQNKKNKEDNLAKLREEEEKRKEITAKFQATLNDVSAMMQDNNEKNLKLREDNAELANRISQLYAHFDQRDEQVARLNKQMEIEKKLADSQLLKAHYEFAAAEQIWAKEKKNYEDSLRTCEETIQNLKMNNEVLQANLHVYTEKYKEFENTIEKSNNVFKTCKKEMVRMNKNVFDMENELTMWKHKWQQGAYTILDLTKQGKQLEEDLAAQKRVSDQLEKLCRPLNAERSAYMKQLKYHGIQPDNKFGESPKLDEAPRQLFDELYQLPQVPVPFLQRANTPPTTPPPAEVAPGIQPLELPIPDLEMPTPEVPDDDFAKSDDH